MNWSSCLVDGVPTLKCLEIVFQNLFTALGGLIFLILLVLFFYGSITWLTAGADPAKVKKAQGIFTSAIIGLVIIATSYLILKIIEGAFGIKVTIFKINEFN